MHIQLITHTVQVQSHLHFVYEGAVEFSLQKEYFTPLSALLTFEQTVVVPFYNISERNSGSRKTYLLPFPTQDMEI